jgi:hypothetical protein
MDLNLNENVISFVGEDLARAPRLTILRMQNNHLTLKSLPSGIFSELKVWFFFGVIPESQVLT